MDEVSRIRIAAADRRRTALIKSFQKEIETAIPTMIRDICQIVAKYAVRCPHEFYHAFPLNTDRPVRMANAGRRVVRFRDQESSFVAAGSLFDLRFGAIDWSVDIDCPLSSAAVVQTGVIVRRSTACTILAPIDCQLSSRSSSDDHYLWNAVGPSFTADDIHPMFPDGSRRTTVEYQALPAMRRICCRFSAASDWIPLLQVDTDDDFDAVRPCINLSDKRCIVTIRS